MFAAGALRKCNDPVRLPVAHRTTVAVRVAVGLTDLVCSVRCAQLHAQCIQSYPMMMRATLGACFELLLYVLGLGLMRCKGCRYCWALEGASKALPGLETKLDGVHTVQ
jgi:hypothetical protein